MYSMYQPRLRAGRSLGWAERITHANLWQQFEEKHADKLSVSDERVYGGERQNGCRNGCAILDMVYQTKAKKSRYFS